MTLQSSGQIKFSEIASEFGGSAPHSLSEVYGRANGIPSSGEISASDLYGASSTAFITTGEQAHTTYDRHGFLATTGIPYHPSTPPPACGSTTTSDFFTTGGAGLSGVKIVGITYYGYPASGTPNLELWYDNTLTTPPGTATLNVKVGSVTQTKLISTYTGTSTGYGNHTGLGWTNSGTWFNGFSSGNVWASGQSMEVWFT